MSTLTDFLLARIAEDEAGVTHDGAHEEWCQDPERLPSGKCFYCGHAPDPTMTRHVPPTARVLAECQAKRAIVALCQSPDPHTVWETEQGQCNECGVLYALAQPYVDHSDFRPEWRIA